MKVRGWPTESWRIVKSGYYLNKENIIFMLKTGCILRLDVVFRDGTVSLISFRCLNKPCSLHKSPSYFLLNLPKEKYDVVSSTFPFFIKVR